MILTEARVKELEAEIAALNKTIQGELCDPNGTIWEAHAAEKARADAAERKLALAVEALERIKKACDLDSVPMLKLAAVLCLQDLTKISSKEER